MARIVSSGFTENIVPCSVILSPIFQPYLLARVTSTSAPARSCCQSDTCSGGTILSLATFKYSSGSVAEIAAPEPRQRGDRGHPRHGSNLVPIVGWQKKRKRDPVANDQPPRRL